MRRKIENFELWDQRNVWRWGQIDGLPAFKWGWAPDGLATRDQLHNLTPKRQLSRGQDPYAVLFWHSSRFGHRTANLYRVDQTRPAFPETPARRRARRIAYLAHFQCRTGHRSSHYVHTEHRLCGPCMDAAGLLEVAA